MTAPFPDRRWGSKSSPLNRVMFAVAATSPGTWLARKMIPLDRRLLIRSRGRFTIAGPVGAPTMLLTTIGAKSGQHRVSPLLYYREDPDLYVVGSNFGQAHHPAWTANLLANPAASVNIDGTEIAATATLVEGSEKERLYREFEKVARNYAIYRSKTSRDIRMFRLSAT
ncbi:nitroreductase family deazaflavin-dependent oxidoreductase [Williamsia sp. R60]